MELGEKLHNATNLSNLTDELKFYYESKIVKRSKEFDLYIKVSPNKFFYWEFSWLLFLDFNCIFVDFTKIILKNYNCKYLKIPCDCSIGKV